MPYEVVLRITIWLDGQYWMERRAAFRDGVYQRRADIPVEVQDMLLDAVLERGRYKVTSEQDIMEVMVKKVPAEANSISVAKLQKAFVDASRALDEQSRTTRTILSMDLRSWASHLLTLRHSEFVMKALIAALEESSNAR